MYTKGTWEAVNKFDDVYGIATDDFPAGLFELATVWSVKHDAKANAHLIAAAPDCHRELSGIVDAFERLGWSSFMAEMHHRLPQAKQALAKADGGK
jgi:hypothetical protein